VEAPPFEEEAVEEPAAIGSKPTAPVPHFIAILLAKIGKFTIAKLKKELRIRGVQYSHKLKKPELQQRLLLAIGNGAKVCVFGNQIKKVPGQDKPTITNMRGFAPGAHWVSLVPDDTAATEPTNTLHNARAPTVPRDEAQAVPLKYNFKEHFDRPMFHGRQYIPRYDRSGNKVAAAAEPQQLVLRKKLVARHKFQICHGLSRHSDPVEFTNAFFPGSPNVYNPNFLSMDKLTIYTNLEAQLANAGPRGSCYKDFTQFNVNKIRQFLGLYIWNGISPSPRINMKLKSPFEDPVHGNRYLYNHIGPHGAQQF
jgi:hypothetical protein